MTRNKHSDALTCADSWMVQFCERKYITVEGTCPTISNFTRASHTNILGDTWIFVIVFFPFRYPLCAISSFGCTNDPHRVRRQAHFLTLADLQWGDSVSAASLHRSTLWLSRCCWDDNEFYQRAARTNRGAGERCRSCTDTGETRALLLVQQDESRTEDRWFILRAGRPDSRGSD